MNLVAVVVTETDKN